jgi:RNA polymerase sigma-70 factor (ECF subfamily)
VSNREDHLKGLMLRGLEGDAQAWRTLLTELGKHLRAYFSRRLFDGGADAEDLVQETLIAIHAKRATWDSKQPFTAWAYTVARYKLIDHLRRTGRRHSHIPIEEAGALFADENAEEGAVRSDLKRMLSILPERQRRLIEDVKLTGCSVAEAAARYGYSETAAKVSIHRSMKALNAHAGAGSGVGDED